MQETKNYSATIKTKKGSSDKKVFCQKINGDIVVQMVHISALNKESSRLIFHRIKKNLTSKNNIIIDIQGVKCIDARGLAFLIFLNKKLKSSQNKLIITNPSAIIHKILGIMEIDQLIKIEENTVTSIPAQKAQVRNQVQMQNMFHSQSR